MVKITAPSVEYTATDLYGDGTSLTFVDGVAETAVLPAPIRAYLTTAGYTVTDSNDVDGPADSADDLDERTVADLRDYALEYGINLDGLTRKADIVAAIRAHFAALPDRTN